MRVYWADANVYIQAANGWYSFDLAPPFWAFISNQLEIGTIQSPKMVFVEITDGNNDDELVRWAKQRRKKGLGVNPDKRVTDLYREILIHVYGSYAFAQAEEFSRGGDGWVIAHALAMGADGIVVTHEDYKARGKVKIPTICDVLGVKWVNLQRVLTNLGFRFSS